MKRTVIEYKKREDGFIEIVGIRNAASPKEIVAEFGEGVWAAYIINGVPTYFKRKRAIIIVHENGSITIRKGGILTDEGFAYVISTMKQAGNRLTEINKKKRAEREAKIVRSVLI